jgi:hypothetical protein
MLMRSSTVLIPLQLVFPDEGITNQSLTGLLTTILKIGNLCHDTITIKSYTQTHRNTCKDTHANTHANTHTYTRTHTHTHIEL